jgi:hypothetical protein
MSEGKPAQGPLRVEGEWVLGEIALKLPPGTRAEAQARAVDQALIEAFAALEAELGVTLAAAPSRFAQPLDGRDAEGRVRFEVRGKLEGDRVVPARLKKVHTRPHADVRAKARAERRAVEGAAAEGEGEGGEGEGDGDGEEDDS